MEMKRRVDPVEPGVSISRVDGWWLIHGSDFELRARQQMIT